MPNRFSPAAAAVTLSLACFSLPSVAASPLQMRVPIGDGATPPAYAAASSIPGFNYTSNWYKAAQGAFSYGNGSYLTTSGNLQAQLTLATTAGATALANMQANPAGVAGTLAQTWLAGKGMTYDSSTSQWMKKPSTWSCNGGTCVSYGTSGGYFYVGPSGSYYPHLTQTPQTSCAAIVTGGGNFYNYQTPCGTVNGTNLIFGCFSSCAGPILSQPAPAPATPSDWAALPDPTPAVGAELPYAPYMPQGAPVGTTTITDLNTGKTYTCTNGACG